MTVPSYALTFSAPVPEQQPPGGQKLVMRTCTICHFGTELDDVVIAWDAGGCVCLRCYGRETGSARPMSETLRRQADAALAEPNLT